MVYRIATTGDQHLGYSSGSKMDEKHVNLRRGDGHRAFGEIVNDIIAHKDRIDSVLLPGDIFHTSHPDNREMIIAQHYLRQLADAGLPVDVFDGNHDTTKKRYEPSAVAVLDDRNRGIRAHWEPYVKQPLGDGIYLHMVPHAGLAIHEAPKLEPVPGAINIYSTHGAAVDPKNNALMRCLHSPGEQVIPPEVILDQEFQLRVLGHYHSRAFVGERELNTWYTGSTLRRRFSDERGSRGWTLFTIHDDGTVEVEHHDVFQRPQQDLEVINAEGLLAPAVQELLIANIDDTRERELGADLDVIRAPIVRQRIINLPRSVAQGFDRKLIAERTAHMSEWVLETARPEEVDHAIAEVLDEDGNPVENTQPSMSRGTSMNVVEAYKEWATSEQSRTLNELVEAERENVQRRAQGHLQEVHDLAVTNDN